MKKSNLKKSAKNLVNKIKDGETIETKTLRCQSHQGKIYIASLKDGRAEQWVEITQ